MVCYTSTTVTFSYGGALHLNLKLVAKHYLPIKPAVQGVTLLFTHGIGAHKEVWEPMLEILLRNANAIGIHDAWSIDWQSHGDAAAVNDLVLREIPDGISTREYAVGLRAFAMSLFMKSCSEIIGIGHCAGSSALLLSTHTTPVPYAAIVLVEPGLYERTVWYKDHEKHMASCKAMYDAISGRRDTWNSREEATAFFKQRDPWKRWDERVLNAHVVYGLKDHAIEEGGRQVMKVTLKCHKFQERMPLKDDIEIFLDAADTLRTLDASFPIHCVLGMRNDVMYSILAMRRMASIQYIPGAGHAVVQENPDDVATCLHNILHGIGSPSVKL
ncbi:hypothetical protein WOLCODRAFT_82589 [Wolfiporia cocos MD-104 SS10]|uniref:AB hydrolase-1 domain-containing protein n=1 Tax=Wolfiporia cocos (strain MD-104) TaxID=742152 RepID=A0A2H3J3C1_WOLCO|nr:hypothetical protein WOLCODRAFT_82589 [Wolfiporia cocos MD-104 SS10]